MKSFWIWYAKLHRKYLLSTVCIGGNEDHFYHSSQATQRWLDALAEGEKK